MFHLIPVQLGSHFLFSEIMSTTIRSWISPQHLPPNARIILKRCDSRVLPTMVSILGRTQGLMSQEPLSRDSNHCRIALLIQSLGRRHIVTVTGVAHVGTAEVCERSLFIKVHERNGSMYFWVLFGVDTIPHDRHRVR